MPLTHKESKYVAARIGGDDEKTALLKAGFSPWIARSANKLIRIDDMRAEVERLQAELVANTLQAGLVDAIEIHEQLTDHLRGDIAELYNPIDPTDPGYNPNVPAGDLLPIPQWPLWARQGGVEVLDEPNMVHSDDEGGGSWDQKGRRIKVKMAPRHKTQELAMKHRGVNAMVQPMQPQVVVNNAIQIRWQDDSDPR